MELDGWISAEEPPFKGCMAIGYIPSKCTLLSLTSARRLVKFGYPRRTQERYLMRPYTLKRRRSQDDIFADYIKMFLDGQQVLSDTEFNIYLIRGPPESERLRPQVCRDRRLGNYRRVAFLSGSTKTRDPTDNFLRVLEHAYFVHAIEDDYQDYAALESHSLSILNGMLKPYSQNSHNGILKYLAKHGYTFIVRGTTCRKH